MIADHKTHVVALHNNLFISFSAQNTPPRTYARVKPKTHLEATYSVPSTSTVTTEFEPVVDINWPQADPEIESFKPDKNYGPEASDPIDIDETQLRILCEERLAEFQKSPEDIAFIEMSTVGQHDNDLYTTHRRDRLTASQFGKVM